jgi:hypothetical protein
MPLHPHRGLVLKSENLFNTSQQKACLSVSPARRERDHRAGVPYCWEEIKKAHPFQGEPDINLWIVYSAL